MNEYGKFAEQTWAELAPTAYAQIKDPNRHFSLLGEQAKDRVWDLVEQLQGEDQPGEEFWDKIGRINMAKLQAEEIVRKELLTPPEDLIENVLEEEQIEIEDDPTQREIEEVWTHMRSLFQEQVDLVCEQIREDHDTKMKGTSARSSSE